MFTAKAAKADVSLRGSEASAVRQLQCVTVMIRVLLHYSSVLRSVCVCISLAYEEPSCTCNDEQCHDFVLHQQRMMPNFLLIQWKLTANLNFNEYP